MGNNPYGAPASAVAAPPAPRPPEVTRAIRILWAVFVVSFVTLHPAIRGEWWVHPEDAELGGAALVIGIFLIVFFSAVYAALVWLTALGHNWARWMFLVLAVLTTLIAATDWTRSIAETPAGFVSDVLMTLAEVWALRLLFFGPGAQWFRR
jgi:hypothetical protein